MNKKGVTTLYSDNYFYSSLDGELVSLGSGNYAAKIEKGNFLKYTLASNVWTVTDKQGTVYKFGTAASSRQDDPGDSSRIYKWMLEEVRDTNNNYISYTYYKDAGQIYPSQIIYSGNSSTAGVFEVNFDRTSRTALPALFNTGFSVTTNYRITEIRTEINNTWARKYTLAYTTPDSGAGSLLDTIVESGQDDGSTVVTLPAVDFDYQTSASTRSWTLNTSWGLPLPLSVGGDDPGTRMADINGDGLLDILCRNYAANSTYCDRNNPKVYLNDGDGTWTDVSSTWLFPHDESSYDVNDKEYFLSTSGGNDRGLRAVDINGDGLADLIRNDGTNSYVYLNTGSGWVYNSSWSFPLPFNTGTSDPGTRMADINGDGLLDLLCNYGPTADPNSICGKNNPQVYLNNGVGGWINISSTWLYPIIGGSGTDREYFITESGGADSGLRTIDYNLDGLTDLIRSNGTYNNVYINTGSGWTYNSSLSVPLPFSVSGDPGTRIADINSDGLFDVLCHNNTTSSDPYCGKNDPRVYLNKGDGTWTNLSSTWLYPIIGGSGTDREYFLSANGGSDSGLRLVDINGDGVNDLVMRGDTTSHVYLNDTTVQSNLLKKITFPQGGNTTITYKATPLFTSGGNLLNSSLPLVNDVVYQIVTNDGSDTAESLTYEYADGLYHYTDYLNRKFAGFNYIKATDAAGNARKVYYYQGNSTNTTLGEYNDHTTKIGIPYRVEEYDSSGNLYRLTVDKIDRYNVGTDHDFVKVIRRTELAYDGNSGHKDTATEYSYDDANGNLLTKTEWGEVTGSTDGTFTDTGSDKRTTMLTYASNSTTLVKVPYNEAVTNQSGTKVKENKYYYDAQSYGSVTNGNQTKVEQWVTGSTYVNSQKSYNSTYGILATETDPRGKVITYATYDSYNIYPITITNPLSQTVQYVYDYSLGKPKQTTDQNGFVYQTTYDGLDRVTAEKIPDFSSPYSAVNKTVYTYTDTSGAVKIQRTDNLDTSTSVDTHQYFDGLGRLIQERREAESNYNVTDTVYTTIGLVQKQSLPYNSSGSAKTAATGTTTLYITNTYDPLNRLATMVDATGTTSYAYDDWKTTVTDKNGEVKRYYKDAYGNLVKVDEVNGDSTYVTNYEWNLNNKLTKITDALGNIRNFTYDGLGRRLTAEDLHASGDSTFGSWTYSYDNAGNLTQVISPRSLTTNYTYNDINQQLTEDYTGVSGTEISYTYGGCTNGTGKLCSVTMASGPNTSYTYDSNGNIASETKTINSTAYTTSYTYDRQVNKLVITYPDSAQVKYSFNSAGLLEKIERKESGGAYTNVISNFDYNPANSITTQAYANGVTTTNTYDATKMYRLTRRLTQNTVPTKLQDLNYTYDNVNNITQLVDDSDTESNKTVDYTYDDLYRLLTATITSASSSNWYNESWQYRVKVSLSEGVPTLTDFPVYLNLANLPAAFHGHVKTDGGDIRVTTADGQTEVPVELVSINTTAETGELHFKAPTTSSLDFYVYYGNSAATLPAANATYGANNVWNSNYVSVHHMADNAANTTVKDSTSHAYHLTNQANTSGKSIAAKLGNGLDYNGTSDYSSFSTAHITDSTWTIQALAKLDTTSLSEYRRIVGFGGWPFPIQIEASQNQTYLSTLVGSSRYNWSSATLNNALHSIVVSYDGTNTKVYYDGTLLQTLGNGVGSLNNSGAVGADGSSTSKWDGIIDEVRFVDTPLSTDWIAAEYENQHTPSEFYSVGTEEAEGSQGQTTQTFTYDTIGNITSGPIGSYTYAGTNYANPHAATTINGATYSYDNSGNLTSNGTLSNTWNYKDQLTQAVVGSATSNYTYDHAGERASLANGTTNVVYPNDYYNTDGTKKTKSIYAGDQLVVTVETVGSTITPYYNHTDHLGSVTAVSDSTGMQVETLDYYPFGEQRISSGTHTSQRQYIGQEYDEETELNYLQARYLQSSTGRFISQDPVFWEVAESQDGKAVLLNPQLQNSYSYAGNNPITMKDPSGRYFETAFDIAMFSLSMDDYNEDPGFWNGVAVAADGLSLALPIPAIWGGVKHGDDAYQAFRVAQDVAKASNWGNAGSLVSHTIRHASDFGLKANDFAGYAKAANNFISNAENAIKQGSKNFDSFAGTGKSAGKTFFFDSKTSMYGVRNADGTVATAYKPKGGDPKKALKYWNSKKKSGGN